MFFKRKEDFDPNLIKKIYQNSRISRYITFMFGLLLIALSYNIFVMPTKIVYGMGGIGVVLKHLYNIDASITILIGSTITLLLSFLLLGKEKSMNSIVGTFMYPLFVKLTEWVPQYIELGNLETVVIVVFGALITGIGLGLVFKAGFTTGGTDILNQIFSKFGHMSIGKAILLTDGTIILGSFFVFGFEVLIYSIISLAIISFITDKVIIGISQSKAFYIITEHETMVKKFLNYQLGHGITVLDGRGGYTGNNQKVIMCIVPTKDYFVVKEGIKRIDSSAFFLVTDAYEVSGGSRGGKNGFN